MDNNKGPVTKPCSVGIIRYLAHKIAHKQLKWINFCFTHFTPLVSIFHETIRNLYVFMGQKKSSVR